MSKFGAATRELKMSARDYHARYEKDLRAGCDNPYLRSSEQECLAAIRVLEAAGKVDKARLISLIDGSELHHACIGGGAADPQMYATDAEANAQLRTILSALPED